MLKTAVVITGIAVGTSLLSIVTSTFLTMTGRVDMIPVTNMVYIAALLIVTLYAFYYGVSIINTTCFIPFEDAFEGVTWLKMLRW